MKLNLVAAAALAAASQLAAAADLSFTAISTPFPNPIGIDYHQPTNSVIMSVNYPSGSPNNLVRVNLDGTQVGFSTLSGLTDELKIATVQPGNGQFAAGTVFTGNGNDGEVVRVSADGSSVINPWVSLPGVGNGLMRGSLFVDRTGVYSGDLIVATTGGEVWRIDGAGTPTSLGDVNAHLEGLMVVPNNAAKWGTLAGKIIAGAEQQGRMYVFDSGGFVKYYDMGLNIEDIDLIAAGQNFFGVNFGTGRLLGTAAAAFAPYAGDILLTQEFPAGGSGLYRMGWDIGTDSPVIEQFGVAAGSAPVGQWEHVTFAPAGIVEIPPVPEPQTYALLLLGLAGISGVARRRPR